MGGEFQDHFFPLLHCGVSWKSYPCFHRTLLIFRSLCACDKRWNVCVDLCSHGFKHQVYCFNSITISLSDMLQYFFNHLQNAPITTTHTNFDRKNHWKQSCSRSLETGFCNSYKWIAQSETEHDIPKQVWGIIYMYLGQSPGRHCIANWSQYVTSQSQSVS